MELIKNTIKVGNSAGVLLPKEYLNYQVKIILEPLNIEKDILDILLKENLLLEVQGLYVTGSYARKEQSIESDVDILVITNSLNKKIIKDKYEILLVSKETLETQLKNNIMPLLPMITEANPIINKDLLENYKRTKITKKNLKWHLEITKSGLKLNRAALDLENETKSKYASDAIAYSLILHLRSTYIVDKLIKNKTWSNKEFITLIKKITNSELAYEGYIRVKSNKKKTKNLPINQAEKLYNYILKEIKTQEKLI